MNTWVANPAEGGQHSQRSSRWAAVMDARIVQYAADQARAITHKNGFALALKRTSAKAKTKDVFGELHKPPRMLRAGLYARVSTLDQQTLPMQMPIPLAAVVPR